MPPLLFRTRFANEIVTEFLPPAHHSNKVVIITSGCPGYPGGKVELMALLAKKGYWSFLPRYRGTWESDGTFLDVPPDKDVLDIMNEVSTPFFDFWSGSEYVVRDPEFYLLGGSFGGPAALLASRDPRVKKAATISSVVDWRKQENTLEPLHLMSEYVPKAFGQAYRADPSVWHKLAEGTFYNPAEVQHEIDGKKLLMIHAKNDMVVHIAPAETFAKEVGAQFVKLSYEGHMGASHAKEPRLFKRIEQFFKGKS